MLPIHHLRLPPKRGFGPGLHDLHPLHSRGRPDTGLGQNVRQVGPALVADNRGRRCDGHGTRAVCAVQVWAQGPGYE